MKKEFHWFQSDQDMKDYFTEMLDKLNVYLCRDMYKTNMALKMDDRKYVLSTQSRYFSQDTLDKKYRLFAHFINGETIEVKRGQPTKSGSKVSFLGDIEKMLLKGEFGGNFDD